VLNRQIADVNTLVTQMGEEELADEFEVNMMESRQAVNFAGELYDCCFWGSSARIDPTQCSRRHHTMRCSIYVPCTAGDGVLRQPPHRGAGIRVHAAPVAAGLCAQRQAEGKHGAWQADVSWAILHQQPDHMYLRACTVHG
jgi:hypothetical protein